MKQQNRTRNVQLILRVTQAEYDHIKKKMALMKTHNFNAYARKMPNGGNVFATVGQRLSKQPQLLAISKSARSSVG